MKQRIKNVLLRLKPTEKVFTDIYYKNIWESDSRSGPGSELTQTKELIVKLPGIFDALEIKSLLDAPCGDFNWMNHIPLEGINYIGGDIVVEIIKNNNRLFAKENIIFQNLDIIRDSLPNVDLILVRDCLVHFSYRDIQKTIKNIKKSGMKYLATTTFTNRNRNFDIPTGEWRLLNLLEPPFNFPEPKFLLNEKCTEGNGQFSDKSLGVWLVSDL
jgi:hypothetical protein